MSVDEGEDLISSLPDPLLSTIISFLPLTEGVRTCVLSQRWKLVWKHTLHLHLDETQMLDHNRDNEDKDVITRENLIDFMLDSHCGLLKSCTIRHLQKNCANGKVIEWIKKLVEQKKVKKLSLEVYVPLYILSMTNRPLLPFTYQGGDLDLPFETFSGFEELELKNYYLKISPSINVSSQVLKSLILKNMNFNNDAWEEILLYCLCLENLTLDNCKFMPVVQIDSSILKFFRIHRMVVSEIEISAANLEILEIDTVVCSKKITLETPKVRVFRFCYDMEIGWQFQYWAANNLLQPREFLSTCGRSQSPQRSTSSCTNIFDKLATLCIDLNLKSVKNVAALLSALEACPVLHNLEINSQANDDARYCDNDEQTKDDYLPYPKYCFWKEGEFYECINHRLETLSIKGFEGEELEVEYLKYIITKAGVMKKIIIWFVDDCSWAQATATRCLLSFPRASPDLSIILKPGPLYLANQLDDNFDTWVSTLRD